MAVKTASRPVNRPSTGQVGALTLPRLDDVIENIVAGVLALALIGYLVYALLRPDRF
ncbi:K(+)-transporting ATPase subunit F [Lapillicoccus jejuensis]|uniref:K+-transporting ATPase KdpF subunit n=1 Tax=Lapillicoccus jejuensis TaxID=402171 RepID=A0A542E3Y5_9MICO|nr:K+-transporting ATPase KdpF subunit [Lapillicoccus jejuensis]